MNLEHFPENETAQRMLGSVSNGFYDDSYVGKWLFQVMGTEMEDARRLVEELPYQAFPETATWGLCYHEIKWGLPVREDLSYEERRSLILEKKGMREPMPPYAMEQLLKNITDFKTYVADIHDVSPYVPKTSHPNVFDVILEGDGTPKVKKIRELLNRMKQSHTMYCLTHYDRSSFHEILSYENSIYLQTEFYPRFNLEYLRLDSIWKLSGDKALNGYNHEEIIDFYPVAAYYEADALEQMQTDVPDVFVSVGIKEDTDTQSSMFITAKAEDAVNIVQGINYQNGAKHSIKTVSYMTKMNQMDARWKLDRRRYLDGGTYLL